MGKLVFVIQAYEMKTETNQLTDNCTIEVFAKGDKEALKMAKKLIKKQHYRVSQIIEKES